MFSFFSLTSKNFIGFKVVFFVKDFKTLGDKDLGWPIFNYLMAEDQLNKMLAQKKVIEPVSRENQVFNYSCSNYPQINRANGIFEVGIITTKNPLINLSTYPVY